MEKNGAFKLLYMEYAINNINEILYDALSPCIYYA